MANYTEQTFEKLFKIFAVNENAQFHRPLARRLGINAALVYNSLTCKAYSYYKRNAVDEDGFFYSTAEDLERSTVLTRRQQDAAVKILVDAGLIDMVRKGMPAKRWFRLCDNVPEELAAEVNITVFESHEEKPNDETATPLIPINPPTLQNIDEPIKVAPDSTYCQIQFAQNVETGFDISSNIYKTISNKQYILNNINPINQSNHGSFAEIKKRLLENIDVDYLTHDYSKNSVSGVIDLLADVINSESPARINGTTLPPEALRRRFYMLNETHIEYVLFCLEKLKAPIRNIRSYLLTALYNAPATMEMFWTTKVQNDLYGKMLV